MVEVIQTILMVILVGAFLWNNMYIGRLLSKLEEVLLRHEEQIQELKDEKVSMEQIRKHRAPYRE